MFPPFPPPRCLAWLLKPPKLKLPKLDEPAKEPVSDGIFRSPLWQDEEGAPAGAEFTAHSTSPKLPKVAAPPPWSPLPPVLPPLIPLLGPGFSPPPPLLLLLLLPVWLLLLEERAVSRPACCKKVKSRSSNKSSEARFDERRPLRMSDSNAAGSPPVVCVQFIFKGASMLL